MCQSSRHEAIKDLARDHDGALLDFDFREAQMARAIIENARHVILVADATKFERTVPVRIGHINQIDTIVTDKRAPTAIQDIYIQHDLYLIETATLPNL